MVKTLSEFWNEVASICYDSSDYGIIAQVRSQFRTNEINKFVNALIPAGLYFIRKIIDRQKQFFSFSRHGNDLLFFIKK